jgi:hypothetical protein
MTFERQDSIAIRVCGADCVRESARTFLRTHGPQPGVSWQEGPSLPPDRSGPAGPLLACAAALAFCSGLVELALSSPFESPAPRWFILAYGVACVLLALLALLLSGPRRRQRRRKGVDLDGYWAATWNGSRPTPAPARSRSVAFSGGIGAARGT